MADLPEPALEQLLVVEAVAIRRLEQGGEPWDYSNVLEIMFAELEGKLPRGTIEQRLAAHYDALNGIGENLDD